MLSEQNPLGIYEKNYSGYGVFEVKKPPEQGASQTMALFSLGFPGASDKYLRWRECCRCYRVPESGLCGSTVRLARQSLHSVPFLHHFQWRNYD